MAKENNFSKETFKKVFGDQNKIDAERLVNYSFGLFKFHLIFVNNYVWFGQKFNDKNKSLKSFFFKKELNL